MANLILDSHNGAVSGEVWVLRSDLGDAAACRTKGKKERARLEFLSHNGAIKALVVRTPQIRGHKKVLHIS